MEYRTVETTAEFVARFETDADWRTEIEDLARKEGIIAGWFTALGAVQNAEVWFSDHADASLCIS